MRWVSVASDAPVWWIILNRMAPFTSQLAEIKAGFSVTNLLFTEETFDENKNASTRLPNLALLWPRLSSLLHVEGLAHPDDRMFYLSTIPRLANLQHLSLSGCDIEILVELTTVFASHNELRSTFPQDYPGLRSLELGDVDLFQDEDEDEGLPEVQKLLQVLPNLQRCVTLRGCGKKKADDDAGSLSRSICLKRDGFRTIGSTRFMLPYQRVCALSLCSSTLGFAMLALIISFRFVLPVEAELVYSCSLVSL